MKKQEVKNVQHKILEFNFLLQNFQETEKILDGWLARGWWIVSSQFTNDGKGLMALLEYFEIEDDEPQPWEHDENI